MSFSNINGSIDESLQELITASKIFVIGAGGIGCELLKNLVLTGFQELHVIDLDTIDLSNLNRQFLFRKQHIGKPKAIVAKESVEKLNPKVKIVAYYDSITNNKYDVDFFRQFSLVANALDNISARTHVNRLCLAADIPLVESGSSGYLGQVTVHKNSFSECYECVKRSKPTTFPACTIRNTPSEPAHCVIWAKHLFNQLFGELDEESEVSPDLTDPNLGGKYTESSNEAGNVIRLSTRDWAKRCKFEPRLIFDKLFVKDIKYLNEMNDLWETRSRPKCLDIENLSDSDPNTNEQQKDVLKDQKLWSLKQCCDIFHDTLNTLKEKANSMDVAKVLLWEKDDDICMDFVASAANLRSDCFGIPKKSKFDLKTIAGNIVPAIAGTNAIVAGLVVLQILKILEGDLNKCRTAYLNTSAEKGRKLLANTRLEKPNSKCYICSKTLPEIKVKLNENLLTMRTFVDKVLKERLHMIAPDIMLLNNIVVSSDPEDNPKDCFEKTLAGHLIKEGSRLLCEDFHQDIKFYIIIQSSLGFTDLEFELECDKLDDDAETSQSNRSNEPESSSSMHSDSAKRSISALSEPEHSKDKDGVLEIECEIQEGDTEPPAKKAKTEEN